MSSSVLSPLPPPTALSSATNHETLAKPAPRRTYGRPRPASPPVEASLPSILQQPASRSNISPAKGLLDRWSGASTSWRDSLTFLDASRGAEDDGDQAELELQQRRRDARADMLSSRRAATPEDDDDVEVGMEEAKREMERMRREARGETAPRPLEPLLPVRLDVSKTKLGISFSSSSLTTLPTSPPPSSSPLRSKASLRSEPSMEEETIPVRKSGMTKSSGRTKRVIASSDEDKSSAGEHPRRTPVASRPRRSPTVSDQREERTRRQSRLPITRSPNIAEQRQGSPSTDPEDAPLDSMQHFLSTLVEDDQQPEKEPQASAESIKDPAGLFDDDEERKGRRAGAGKAGKPLKSLNQKELADMRKDIARAQRERPVAISKPEVVRLPISSWLALAGQVISNKTENSSRNDVPVLTFARGSSQSSPLRTTPPDEIVAFTPYSTDHFLPTSVDTAGPSERSVERVLSSPIARRQYRDVVPSTSEDLDDEPLPEIEKMFDQDDRRQLFSAARKRTAELKAAAMKAPAKLAESSDDDFDIYHDSPQLKTAAAPRTAPYLGQAVVPRNIPDARAILKKTSASPAVSKQRQAMLRRAGKAARPKEDVTETLVAYASKTFKHAELKRANAGSVPAGQKKGRDNQVSQAQIDAMIKAKHQQQITALQRKKEEEWGRVRALPKKEQHNMKAIIELTVNAVEDAKDDSEDEEDEDEDFVPEGRDAGDDGDGIAYSGEESEAGDGSQEDEVEDGPDSPQTDKENLISDNEEEAEPVIRHKARTSKRVAFDSDDDENTTTPRAHTVRAPLTEMIVAQQVLDPIDIGLDLAGFDASGGGFSQLFEATQRADQPTFVDGFAQLRDQAPIGLFPAHALLPQVEISETQVERDNALIAGEAEDAMERSPITQPKSKAQYLNDRGFFTQTRPRMETVTQLDDNTTTSHRPRQALAGKSALSLMGYGFGETQPAEPMAIVVESLPYEMPSSTEKGSDFALISSPTQETPVLSRLRRRTSPDPVDTEALAFSSQSIEESVARPKNAFDRLMGAANQPRERPAEQYNLFDEQAEESDEDNGWAPIGGEEDDDDEDEDGYVPDLVNDEQIEADEKKRQDELAAEKAREIAAADDVRREAEARKITEGQYRTKRKGLDFFSDEEDDKEKSRRPSKSQRRKRRLDREDGLDKLDGEANVFKQAYENDLESDVESVEGEPEPGKQRSVSPVATKPSRKDTWELLRQRGRMNREKDAVTEAQDLDREIGYDASGFRAVIEEDEDSEMLDPEEESQYSISRSVRTASTSIVLDGGQSALRRMSATRNVESYVQYVRDESQTNRRVGGAAGVSVVVNNHNRGGPGARVGPSRQSSTRSAGRAPSRQGSGSILMSKTNKFM